MCAFRRPARLRAAALSFSILLLCAAAVAQHASPPTQRQLSRVMSSTATSHMRAGPSSGHSVVGSIPPSEAGPPRRSLPRLGQVEYKGIRLGSRKFSPRSGRATFSNALANELMAVVGVASYDVLMVRTAPSQQAPVAHVYPPTAACVVGMGECQGSWCQVRIPARDGYQVGWVDAKQVAPSNAACN